MVRTILTILLAFFLSNFTTASHVVGGNIKYTYVGKGSAPGTHKYKVTLGIYRDCNSIRYTTTQERITAICMPGKTPVKVQIAPKVNYVPKPGERPANFGAKDVSDICRNKSSRCAGKGNPGGYEINYYETIFELPACNYWEFYVSPSQCCTPNLTNTTGAYYAPISRLNSKDFPKNSSPNFADEEKPLPTVCAGQDVFYGVGTHDSDGDSLRFELDCGVDRINTPGVYTCVQYRSGFSAKAPIPGLKLDSSSGLISFKTTRTGKYLVAFWVIEYERCTGKEIGRTMREVQFDVRSCSNNVPKDISGISNIKGARKTGRFKLEVCNGQKISWEDTIYDKDVTDTIRFGTNLNTVLPGATMKTTFLTRNRAIVKFEWTASIGINSYKSFFLKYDDDRCDYPGNGYSVFDITVIPGASAGKDQVLCYGDTTFIKVTGGTHFTWRSLSGNTLIPGTNWFPDTTTSDTAKTVKLVVKNQPFLLEIKSNLAGGCQSRGRCSQFDTILIKPVDSFSLKTIPDFTICKGNNGYLNVEASDTTHSYSYKWNNSSLLDNDSISKPVFLTGNQTTNFNVKVTSDSGCVRQGEVFVTVAEPLPTGLKANVSDTLVCIQKQIKFTTEKGKVDYGNCGEAKRKCQGNFKDFIVGNGSRKNMTNGSNIGLAYSGTAKNVKNQYMYRASQLNAMGIEAGPMKSIAFYLDSIYKGRKTIHKNMTIKMGCSPLNELPKFTYISGLQEVYYPKNDTAKKGWNKHEFDVEYNWDGKSNLVVEICSELSGAVDSGNHIQSFDVQSYRASNHVYSYFQPVCFSSGINGGAFTNVLPQTKFNVCTGFRSGVLNYSWHPTFNGGFIGATNKGSATANANLATAKKYFVVITDSATGICKDTIQLKVNVVSSYNTKPRKLPAQCFYTKRIIQMKSNTPHNIVNPGGKWAGVGIINDSLGYWDASKSGQGRFWVKYSVTGNNCASVDSTELKIFGLPDATILTADSMCGIYGGGAIPDTLRHRLIPKNQGGWFTGYGVDSVLNANGEMVYFLNGTKFTPAKGSPDTATITYTLTDGCTADSTFKVPVVAAWDHSFHGVIESGKSYPTINFCSTNPILDTLSVAGANPVWEYLDFPSAMINRNMGVINSKIASFGVDTVGRVKVGNYGFCGSDTIIRVNFIKPPEIEILPNIYCEDYLNDTTYFNRVDSVELRIPKGPMLSGSTGKKELNPAGFDPNTEVKVIYASIKETGWSQAIDRLTGQYNYNFWQGRPWTFPPNVARYRIIGLPKGKNKISYTFGYRYRNNHPNFACQTSDTAYVERRDSLNIALPKTGKVCGNTPITLDAGVIKDGKYLWGRGDTTQKIIVNSKGTYSVTVTANYCKNSKRIVVISECVGIEEGFKNEMSIKLFPNPASNTIFLKLTGGKSELTELRIFNLQGAEISNSAFKTLELEDAVQIDASDLKAGTYLFQILNGSSFSTYRVVIE